MISGRKLLSRRPQQDGTFYIHSIWLHKTDPSRAPPDSHEAYLRSWKHHHPEEHVVHVLWTGDTSVAFLNSNYPDRVAFFHSLMSEVQQSDYLRLLLLHHFAGLYVDVDCECRGPIVERLLLHTSSPLLLLKSPLFCESYTNCFMGSLARRHDFWLSTADVVEETVYSVRGGYGLSKACSLYFVLPLIGSLLQVLCTNTITGPSCIDRTIASFPKRFASDIERLMPDEYYAGPRVIHHESGMWLPTDWIRFCQNVAIVFTAIATTVAVAFVLAHTSWNGIVQ